LNRLERVALIGGELGACLVTGASSGLGERICLTAIVQ
jgi:hypothetical protein